MEQRAAEGVEVGRRCFLVVVWAGALALLAAAGACDLGGGGAPDGGSTATGPRPTLSFPEVLAAWDEQAGVVVDQLGMVAEDVVQLDLALQADDDLSVDLYADLLATDVALYLAALTELDALEDEIRIRQGATGERVELSQQPLVGLIAVGATLWGLYKFGQAMEGFSEDMSAGRQRRDKALEGLGSGQAGAEEAYRRAKDDMEAAGEGAVTELSTKVTTDLVLSPVAPKSVVGVVLKERTGDRVQQGLKVLAGTEGCEQGAGGDCRVAAGRTDAQGRVSVPSGRVSVAVSGGGNARVSRRGVDAPAGGEGRVEVPVVAMTTATPSQVAAADDGRLVDPDPPAGPDAGPPPGPDAGSGAGTVAGAWPREPLGGLSLTYAIEGLVLGEPYESLDWAGWYAQLVYPVEAVTGPIRVHGACAWASPDGTGELLQGSARIMVGVEPVSVSRQGDPTLGPWSWPFDVTSAAAPGASPIYVSLECAWDPAPGQQYWIQVRATTPD
jgi:hypothetical protein